MVTLVNGVPYRQNLVPQSKWNIKAPYAMKAKKVTLHETDNQVSANNEINYMNGNNNQTSYHVAIDDKEAVQAIPFDRNAWHAGDGGNGYGNRNTIAFEICQNYDRARATTVLNEPLKTKYDKGVANAIKVIAQIMLQEGIEANNDNIKTHNDWNGKHCPRKMRNDGKVMIVKAGIIQEYQRLKGEPIVIAKPDPIVITKRDGTLTFNQVVDKAIANGYGVWPERKANIENHTNFKYDEIQQAINKKFEVAKPIPAVKKPTAEEVAQEIALKKHNWGNNPDRERKLKAEGYDAKWIQARINAILAGNKPTNVAPSKPKVAPAAFYNGQRVNISQGAQKYVTGQNIPNYIKNQTHTILDVKTDRVLLKEILSWVYIKDIVTQSTPNTGQTAKPATKGIKVGDTIRVKALYGSIHSKTNVRKTPINGYVIKTNAGGINPIQLLNKKGGYIIGYTNKNAIV